ncbi:hypothetical protein PYR73_00465 [Acinetobacter soli]|nr:hypothetical protein PX669_12085 [Acinetobacter soli]WEI09732.1 hypothetical protein PYR73_00465 [Acinetobacter soli]
MYKSNYFSNIWNRIYKNDLIKSNSIYFPNIYLSEDMCFSFVTHAFARKAIKVGGCFYYYNYNRENSTTDLRKSKKGFEIINSFEMITRYFINFSIYENSASYLVYKKLNSLWYTYDRIDESLKVDFIDNMKKLYHSQLKNYLDLNLFTDQEKSKLQLLEY